MTDIPAGVKTSVVTWASVAVFTGKDAPAYPRVQRTRCVASDEMQQAPAAAAADRPLKDLRQGPEIVKADVLEHPDRDERIEFPFDAAVVIVDELHSIGEAFAAGTVAGKRQLFPRDVERLHPRSIMLRHMQRQRAPAAPGFDDGVPWLKSQLAADEIELGMLRLVERHPRVGKIGARL